MNVLVVPEDFPNDRHILKPLFSRLFAEIGKPRAKVRICQDPRLRGVNEALKPARIAEIVSQYRGMTHIFILCVDRDGKKGRRQQLNRLESKFGTKRAFFAENAWEEIETWALAGLHLSKKWRWAKVRAEVHVKERYFDELARSRGLIDKPGGGRKELGEEAARQVRTIRKKCPEDFDKLSCRIEAAAAQAWERTR